MKYEVREGVEFPLSLLENEIEKIKLEIEKTKLEIEKDRLCKEIEGPHNRTLILWVFLSMAAVFFVGAATKGIIEGNFGALQYVYDAIIPIISGIAGYYYAKKPITEKR